ncbi:MFS transporter [Campylobacter upsaliensis]|nr:MFS transporter [Campylobacter upsaliensis]EAL3900753.1 MFS transporter [Campylobacter upsaliensis]EIL6893946.1 MFS transporter [Campylobacter upsaliensis]EKP4839037.1 MFS transporter [Campylobacter upsaliensis]
MKHLILLKTNQNIRILAIAQFIVYFGALFSQIGVFTLLVQLNAPTWVTATSAMLAFLPGVLFAPLNGVIVEKNKPKNLLIGTISIELISVFLLIFVTSLNDLWLLFILIFSRLCVAMIYGQAEMSLMAKLLNQEDLKLANEIYSINWSVSYTLGMASAGFFIHFFGVKAAFLFDTFLLLIGILILLKLSLPNFVQKVEGYFFAMIKEGFYYVLKNKIVLHLIILHAFIGFTAYETLVTLLAQHEYKEILSAGLVMGFLNAVRALSLIIGPFILSRFLKDSVISFLYVGQGLGILLWALTQFNFYISFIGLIGAGFFTTSLWSYTYTSIQKHCDEKFYGRVLAYTDMVFLAFSAFISQFMGFLFEAKMSLMNITALLGIVFILAGLYWHIFYKKYLC